MRTYTETDILKILRERFAAKGAGSRTQIAARLGFTTTHIVNVLAGKSPVSKQLASTLGFDKLPDRYVRKQRGAA